MAFTSGHGGSIVGAAIPFAAHVRTWSLDSTAQLHDVTVMGAAVTVRSRILGLADFTATLDFFVDNGTDIDSTPVGGAVADFDLLTNSTDKWESTGIIESINTRTDVDGAVSGTMVMKANGVALTYTQA